MSKKKLTDEQVESLRSLFLELSDIVQFEQFFKPLFFKKRFEKKFGEISYMTEALTHQLRDFIVKSTLQQDSTDPSVIKNSLRRWLEESKPSTRFELSRENIVFAKKFVSI